MGSQRIESITNFKSFSVTKCIKLLQLFIKSDRNSSRDMATRTTTNYSGLPRRRGGVAASKPVAGVKMASKAGTKPAARRLLKSPVSSNDEIDSMDLDSLDIISYKDEIEKRYKDRRPALPKGVNNIDTDENPQLCAEYAQD